MAHRYSISCLPFSVMPYCYCAKAKGGIIVFFWDICIINPFRLIKKDAISVDVGW